MRYCMCGYFATLVKMNLTPVYHTSSLDIYSVQGMLHAIHVVLGAKLLPRLEPGLLNKSLNYECSNTVA